MASSTAIDVVIPAYNEEAHIEGCLDRVFAQDYAPERFRVWVVDAGSSDHTADVVRRYAERQPRLSLVTGRGRLNAGQAMNAGIEQGSGDLIARVDAHSFLEPDYLRMAAEVMAEEDDQTAEVG